MPQIDVVVVVMVFFLGRRKKVLSKAAAGNGNGSNGQTEGGALAAVKQGQVTTRKRASLDQEAEQRRVLGNLGFVDMTDDKEAERYLGSYVDAEILTGADGELKLSDEYQRAVCALDNGIVVVCAESDVFLRAYHYVLSGMKRAGITVGTTIQVSPDFLERFYKSRGKLRAQVAMRDVSRVENKLHLILDRAAQVRASDVHVVVDQVRGVCRMRVDGSLTDGMDYERLEMSKISAVAYFLADDSEGGQRDINVQQTARWSGARARLPLGVDGLRLQWMPLAGGCEQLVSRLFYMESHSESQDVDSLGYTGGQVALFRDMRRLPYGMVMISGVTGSGKSTTLAKTLMAQLRERPGINLMTVEDPPEYRIQGARQVPVTARVSAEGVGRAGAFAVAIAGVLRSDPDVIMVGEIRDKESAKLGVEAVLTGHQMWTTVHAINAVLSVQRLLEMGVDPHVLLDPSVVTGLVSQRLVPMLCPACSRYLVSPGDRFKHRDDLRSAIESVVSGAGSAADGIRVRNVDVGDEGCGSQQGCRRGYMGRSVVAEVVRPDAEFMEAYKGGQARRAEEVWLGRADSLRKVEHGAINMLMGRMDPVDLEESVGLVGGFTDERRWAHVHRAAMEDGLEFPGTKVKPIEAASAPKERVELSADDPLALEGL